MKHLRATGFPLVSAGQKILACNAVSLALTNNQKLIRVLTEISIVEQVRFWVLRDLFSGYVLRPLEAIRCIFFAESYSSAPAHGLCGHMSVCISRRAGVSLARRLPR